MSEEEQSEVRAGGADVGDPVELPSSIKVPEPPRQRRRYLERTPSEEGPEERYGQRFRSWARRHLLDSVTLQDVAQDTLRIKKARAAKASANLALAPSGAIRWAGKKVN